MRHMRRGRRSSGQALAELGIIIVLTVSLAMMVIEFGRAWMIVNMITHAARDGGRAAAVTPTANRAPDGTILDTSAIQTRVMDTIETVMDPSTITGVVVGQSTVGGIPLVTVTINGAVPYLFGFLGTDFNVERSVSFRDEGR